MNHIILSIIIENSDYIHVSRINLKNNGSFDQWEQKSTNLT